MAWIGPRRVWHVVLGIILLVAGLFTYTYVGYMRAKGALVVETWPVGAAVYLDGEYRGTTPLRVGRINVGVIEVRLVLAGYEEANVKLAFTVGQQRHLRVVLSDQRVEVTWPLEVTSPLIGIQEPRPGRVIVTSADGGVTALNWRGERLWQFFLGETVVHPPSPGASVVVGGLYGRAAAIDVESGRLLWEASWPSGTRVVGPGAGEVVVLTKDGRVFGVATTDGAIRWQAAAIDLRWGQRRGVFYTRAGEFYQGDEDGLALVARLPDGTVLGRLAMVGDDVVVMEKGEGLRAVSLSDHGLRWTAPVEGTVTMLQALGDHVVVGTEDGNVLVYSGDSGELRWRAELGSSPTAAAIVGGKILVGSVQHGVYAFTAGGDLVGRKAFPGAVVGMVVSEDQALVAVGVRDRGVALLRVPPWW
ncbi:PQQ-binding-like beta-propeller repeat protein [Candidatus Bipolaricaulota bacterium]|nr:PQQ-binding-like beta-propeller repeat protein [Candidatus Bipolaricaulota bacterium]